MFQKDIATSLPPTTLSLIAYLLDSPYITLDIYNELLDAISALSTNCWTIYKHALAEQEQKMKSTNSSSLPPESISIETMWLPVLRLTCQQCLRVNPDEQLDALVLLEDLMCDSNLLVISSAEYNEIISKIILPTLREVLLQAAGISQSTTDKPRVTRMSENEVLENLLEMMVAILQVRFESLLVLEGFGTLWSQILSIVQFVQTISIADGTLQQQNVKALTVLLKHTSTFGVFDVRRDIIE